ncbi:MAG: elongator complex protein 3 [Candidatus Heteroscillospira sp.]|jgi:histone acetyltransferase (RNA polymerase elongator complex component)
MSRIIPIFIPHTGCPMDCVFCNQKRISGSLLPATASDVKNTVEESLEKLPEGSCPEIAFYGGSFTAIPPEQQVELLESAYAFIRAGLVSSIRLSTRPDAIDTPRLDRLEKYGVKTIELGSQSMDDGVLLETNRGHTAAHTVAAAELIRSRGFTLILQMMTGLPGSDDEKDVDTAKRLAALKPDGVRIYPTVIVRDTELYERWLNGKYAEHTVEDAVRVCARILPIFEAAGIPVIRLGLNPTEELSGGGAVGGAYHPALGELVLSRLMLSRMLPMLEPYRGAECVTLSVPPSRVSAAVGHKRCNVGYIRQNLDISRLKILGNAREKEEISIVSVAKN